MTAKLEWGPAPTKTQWGHDMVEASIAIDKDHTLSIYCEASQTLKVEALINKPWVGLTHEEVKKIAYNNIEVKVARDIEAKLREKNSQ